jgi:hypothetical protein
MRSAIAGISIAPLYLETSVLYSKIYLTHPEDNDTNTSPERNHVVQGDVLVVLLNYAGPDQVTPVGAYSSRTR